jgi:RNA polymerase sigma factor (sigma-70 family)
MRLGENLAEEIAAEAFCVAFRRREVYDLRAADARPWLYGICTNLIREQRRREVRRYRAYARAGTEVTADGHEDRVAERVSADLLRPGLAAGLARLSAADRDVLLLVATAQLSYEEVGQALGIPAGTVGSRLSRARRKVRAALEEWGSNHG